MHRPVAAERNHCRRPALPGLAAAAVALAGAAHAAAADGPGLPLWELGLGAAGVQLPHYRGSDQNHSWLLPVPYAVYRGTIFKADREGARALLLQSRLLELDLSLGAAPPANSSDNRARSGMKDLPPSFELGPKVVLHLVRQERLKLNVQVPLRAVLAFDSGLRHIGWTLEPELNLDWSPGGWNLGANLGPLWGDRRLHQHFYGVRPAEATAQRPAYVAAGGSAGWQATLGVSRRWGLNWAGAFVRADSLRGTAFDGSPLLKERSNVSFGVAYSRVLYQSAARAPVGSDQR